MSLVETILSSLFTTTIVFVLLITLTSLHSQFGDQDAIVADTNKGLMSFVRMPSAEMLPYVVSGLIVIFLGSALFHHKRQN